MHHYIILLAVLSGFCDGKFSESLQLTLSHGGGVYGRYMTSNSGWGIRAFRGIPYAEPPIGNLRFSDPVEKGKWTGFIDGDKNRVNCTHVDFYTRQSDVHGQEDCLYLNVFVPKVPDSTDLLPVMFFIHGGGYSTGSGGIYEPDYLLDHDVILVTGNYRLGALGFLSMGNKELPGNYGLKDQVLMLKWIKKHIKNFGGDPGKVTIFGNSAGAASVGLHLISPMSKGLFHQAIIQSGSPYDPWAVKETHLAINNTIKLLDFVRCPFDEDCTPEVISCLKEVESNEIAEQIFDLFLWDINPSIPFGPVIENEESENPFLTQKSFDEGPDPNIPIIMGITANEGGLNLAIMTSNLDSIPDLEDNLSGIMPFILSYSHLEDTKKSELTEKLLQFYIEKDTFNWKEDLSKLNNMISDGWHLTGLNQFLEKRFSKGSKSNTFVYLLDHRAEASFADLAQEKNDNVIDFGVTHCDELLYLFPFNEDAIDFREPTKVDLNLKKTLLQNWVNFAKFGQPKTEIWKSATKFPLDYLRIGSHNLKSTDAKRKMLTMESDLFPERSEFWGHTHSQVKLTPKSRDEL